jgi:hypothetical protein
MILLRRRRRPTVSIEDLLPAVDETGHHLEPVAPWRDEPYNRLERAETQNQMRGCIDRLPDDYRFVLVLRDIKELDTEETAEVLGISTAAVKTGYTARGRHFGAFRSPCSLATQRMTAELQQIGDRDFSCLRWTKTPYLQSLS